MQEDNIIPQFNPLCSKAINEEGNFRSIVKFSILFDNKGVYGDNSRWPEAVVGKKEIDFIQAESENLGVFENRKVDLVEAGTIAEDNGLFPVMEIFPTPDFVP